MKSEKKKMLLGELYNASDEELTRERDYARILTFQFNHTDPNEKDKSRQCSN